MSRSTTILRNLEPPGYYTWDRPVALDDIVVWKLTLEPSKINTYKMVSKSTSLWNMPWCGSVLPSYTVN